MSTCLKGKKNLEEAATKTKHNFTTFVLKKNIRAGEAARGRCLPLGLSVYQYIYKTSFSGVGEDS